MNGNENLQEYMKARGQEEGWDASKAVDELVDLGQKNQNMLGMDVAMSFTPLPISQSHREGKPNSLAEIVPGVKQVDRFYPVVTKGRDLQYDITHPGNLLNPKNFMGVSVSQQIIDVFNQGIRNLNNWFSR